MIRLVTKIPSQCSLWLHQVRVPAKLSLSLWCSLLSICLNAQVFTENFEGINSSGKPVIFVNNGQSFTAVTATPGGSLGGLFGIYIPGNTWTMPSPGGGPVTNGPGGFGVGTSCNSGVCSGVSDKFLDNGLSAGKSQVYSIKATDGHLFAIKSIFLFFSSDNGNSNVAPSSLLITGKKSGSTVFNITKSSGFNSGFSVNNGFNFIDFSTEGGTDHSNTAIDEVQFSCGSNVNYFAVDNFTWGPASGMLPLKLINFNGAFSQNFISLHWQTTSETNMDHIELQRSNNNIDWTIINRQKPKGSTTAIAIDNKYDFIDYDLNDINFYRLKMVDLGGGFSYSQVISINIGTQRKIKIYPNPAHNQFNLVVDGSKNAVIKIINSNGVEVRTLVATDARLSVNISDLRLGVYTILIFKKGSIRTIRFLKQ